MWRYLAGVASALLLVAAGVFLSRSTASTETPATPRPRLLAAISGAPAQDGVASDPLPAAPARSREQKRFDRYDKDRDAQITRDEYLTPRRKAFAKLDVNGDGRLAFDEWATRTTTKFAAADRDRSGSLTATEFATTALKRQARPRCACPAAQQQPDD